MVGRIQEDAVVRVGTRLRSRFLLGRVLPEGASSIEIDLRLCGRPSSASFLSSFFGGKGGRERGHVELALWFVLRSFHISTLHTLGLSLTESHSCVYSSTVVSFTSSRRSLLEVSRGFVSRQLVRISSSAPPPSLLLTFFLFLTTTTTHFTSFQMSYLLLSPLTFTYRTIPSPSSTSSIPPLHLSLDVHLPPFSASKSTAPSTPTPLIFALHPGGLTAYRNKHLPPWVVRRRSELSTARWRWRWRGTRVGCRRRFGGCAEGVRVGCWWVLGEEGKRRGEVDARLDLERVAVVGMSAGESNFLNLSSFSSPVVDLPFFLFSPRKVVSSPSSSRLNSHPPSRSRLPSSLSTPSLVHSRPSIRLIEPLRPLIQPFRPSTFLPPSSTSPTPSLNISPRNQLPRLLPPSLPPRCESSKNQDPTVIEGCFTTGPSSEESSETSAWEEESSGREARTTRRLPRLSTPFKEGFPLSSARTHSPVAPTRKRS